VHSELVAILFMLFTAAIFFYDFLHATSIHIVLLYFYIFVSKFSAPYSQRFLYDNIEQPFSLNFQISFYFFYIILIYILFLRSTSSLFVLFNVSALCALFLSNFF
jgi:hypothetical protein